MVEYFDKTTKPFFKDASETTYIKFGSMGCNDPKVKIRRGQLPLTGYAFVRHVYGHCISSFNRQEMASFFQPSLDGIVAAVQRQRQAASRPISVLCSTTLSDHDCSLILLHHRLCISSAGSQLVHGCTQASRLP